MDTSKFFAVGLVRIERCIYVISAAMLSVAAFVVFGHAVYEFIQHLIKAEVSQAIISLLENILLALMLAELLHTLKVSIESKGLIPEPFLIVALVAAVRRILAISVEGSQFIESDPAKFNLILTEIGVLAAFIIVLVVSIYILRKKSMAMPQADES